MQPQPANDEGPSENGWEPISEIPDNLEPDGRNYIEWTWSLLDDGNDVCDQASFSTLKTSNGEPLLAEHAARHLDEQMLIAMKAATENGHLFADVILCCKAPDIDSTKSPAICSSYSFSIRLPRWRAQSRLAKSATWRKISARRRSI